MDVNSSLVLLFMFSFANLRKATEGEKCSAECVQHLCVFTVAMRRSFFFFQPSRGKTEVPFGCPESREERETTFDLV